MADMGTPRSDAAASGANLLVSNATDYANTMRNRVHVAQSYVVSTKEALAVAVKEYADARVELASADAILAVAKAAVQPIGSKGWQHYAWIAGAVLAVVAAVAVAVHFVW